MMKWLCLSETERFPRYGSFSCKIGKVWGKQAPLACTREWVCPSKLSHLLDEKAGALFNSEEVHLARGHTSRGWEGMGWKFLSVRTLARSHCGSCRRQGTQSHSNRYQLPGILERLLRTQGWHKEEQPRGHTLPTMEQELPLH